MENIIRELNKGDDKLNEERTNLQITTVKLVQPKLLKEVLMELEEKMSVPLLSFIENGRVVVLVNGKTTTDLMHEVKPESEIVVLPALRGG